MRSWAGSRYHYEMCGHDRGLEWVKGGCRRQVDRRAGLPSAPEMPCAPRRLRLVPIPDLMVEVQLVDRTTAKSVRGTGLALSEIKDLAAESRVRRIDGRPLALQPAGSSPKIDRLVFGAHVRR